MRRHSLPSIAPVLILVLLLPSCSSLDRPTISGFFVPAMTADADEDDNQPDGDRHFDADVRTGHGIAVRAGFHDDDEGFGILYMRTEHEERETDAPLRTHAAYVEYYARHDFDDDPPYVYGGIAVGVGGAVFDFDRTFSDTGAAAAEIRGEIGVAATRFLRFHAGGGGYLWGYPGETIGYGGFVLLGATVDF